MKKISLSLLLLLASLTATAQPGSYVPSEENLRARQEFQDNKLGVFIHWGVYSMLADGEWVMHHQGCRRPLHLHHVTPPRRLLDVQERCQRLQHR